MGNEGVKVTVAPRRLGNLGLVKGSQLPRSHTRSGGAFNRLRKSRLRLLGRRYGVEDFKEARPRLL